MSSKHTPLTVELYDEGGANITDPDGFVVAEVSSPFAILQDYQEKTGERHWAHKPGVTYREVPEDESHALAQRLVKAANLAPRLAEILAEIVKSINDLTSPQDGSEARMASMWAARADLATLSGFAEQALAEWQQEASEAEVDEHPHIDPDTPQSYSRVKPATQQPVAECNHTVIEQVDGTEFKCKLCGALGNPDYWIWGEPEQPTSEQREGSE